MVQDGSEEEEGAAARSETQEGGGRSSDPQGTWSPVTCECGSQALCTMSPNRMVKDFRRSRREGRGWLAQGP